MATHPRSARIFCAGSADEQGHVVRQCLIDLSSPMMHPLRLRAYTVTSALGAGVAAHRDALRAMRSGIVRKQWETVEPAMCIGEVDGLDYFALCSDLRRFDCRNNRLAQFALEQDDFVAAA